MAKALSVANEFLRLAKEKQQDITNMQIQKLVYTAHGLSLGYTGKPLLDEEVNAWKHGPVIPVLYHKYKKYINANIDVDKEFVSQDDLTTKEKEIIEGTYNNFSRFSGWQLRELTHKEGSPWHKIWYDKCGNATYNAVMPNEVIRKHYEEIKATGNASCL